GGGGGGAGGPFVRGQAAREGRRWSRQCSGGWIAIWEDVGHLFGEGQDRQDSQPTYCAGSGREGPSGRRKEEEEEEEEETKTAKGKKKGSPHGRPHISGWPWQDDGRG
ncbi:hypothetical protein KEM55_006527, partial [Ascosphaera atra]